MRKKQAESLSSDAKLDYVALFILNAAGMILELVASRLMSPYFGGSNFVWTAIIGIILLAGSLGNIIGGKFAKYKEARLITALLLIGAAIYLAITPLIDVPILTAIKSGNLGTQFSAVVGSIIFFLVPATILGVITPIIMKERIGTSADAGKESGRITAIIAIGSLIGTFAGGFWIVPVMGTKMIFVLISFVVLITVPLLRPLAGNRHVKAAWLFFVMAIIAAITVVASAAVVGAQNWAASTETSISIDTEYGRIIIEEGEYNGEKVRFYKQSGAYSSATFIDEERKYNLVYDYIKKYDEMFKFKDVKATAMIGGAAYQYPKYFISTFLDKTMDVIEIDPVSTEIAKKYFYLDDLTSDYGGERLGLYNEDGRVFMADGTKKYDAILNDAFSGEVPVGTLATTEAATAIKNRLNSGGVYLSNVLGAASGAKSKFLKAEVKTLKQVFRYVYVLPVYPNVKKDVMVNWMVVATDSEKYVPEDAVELKIDDETIVLTDDYCPIDALVSTEYFD